MEHLIKIIITTLLLSPSLFASSPTSLPFDSCTESFESVVSQKIVTNAAPVRWQNELGYCYAFTALYLLDHHYCQKRVNGGDSCQFKTNGREGDDRLSAFDALQISGDGRLKEGGHFAFTLLKLKQNQYRISKSVCAPFSKYSGHVNILSILKYSYSDWMAEAPLDEYEMLTFSLEQQNEFVASAEELRSAFQMQKRSGEVGVDVMMTEVFNYELKRCESQRLQLPPFEIVTVVTKNDEKIKEVIREAIYDFNRPLAIGYKSPGGGGHAVAITGTREVICKGQRQIQYQIADSADGRSKWVNGSRLISAAKPFIASGVGLNWLVPSHLSNRVQNGHLAILPPK